MKRGSQRWWSVIAIIGLGLCVLPAVLSLIAQGRLFAGRVSYPIDLEWMEGGMLVHAQRIADGQGIYVAPSMEFIPYLYTPLYPALVALLSFVFPLGYVLGRLVSISAFAGALLCMVVAVIGEARERQGRWLAALAGIAGAGAVASGFAFTGQFYDLVRADSLLLLLEVIALGLALRGKGWPSAVVGGIVIALGFFTKQTASILGIGIGLGLLIANWRRALCFGAAAAVTLGTGFLLLMRTSDGWFWTYVFQLHQSHAFSWNMAFVGASVATAKHGWPVYAALVLVTGILAWRRGLRRADAILFGSVLAGQAAAMVGFGTKWAFANAFIPAVFFPVLAAALLTARLLGEARTEVRIDRRWLTSPGAAATLALLAWQPIHAQAAATDRTVPTSRDRVAAAALVSELRELPGPLFIPSHSYYGVLAGKRSFVHRIGLYDVDAAFAMRERLASSLREQTFASVVLDWKPRQGEWPSLESRYHVLREFNRGIDSVGMFAGVPTAPRLLFVRTIDPPPLPPQGKRLCDFESGTYDGFLVDGEAMGRAPAPAPAGMYGRFAVDSARLGKAARGRLISGSFVVDRPNIAFTLAGPDDAKLRVVLYVEETPVRTTSPSGGARQQVWDVRELMEKSAAILIEDDSLDGGLAADEFVAY